jgi:hypothetical protein
MNDFGFTILDLRFWIYDFRFFRFLDLILIHKRGDLTH